MQRRLAFVLEYQGTRYKGYQVQSRAPTVQGEIEGALESLLGEHVKTQGASRTDTGAHAKGQVVAFTTVAAYSPETFVRALNARLPMDIRVQAGYEVDPTFDPRRHATSRTYRYLVLNRRRPSALWRHFAYRVGEPLDCGAMDRAAGSLVGVHDQAPFGGSQRNRMRRTPQRVLRAQVRRHGEMVVLGIEADAFLPYQVRRMAGALVQTGRGSLTVEVFRELGKSQGQSGAPPSLPACGLYLMVVSYPPSVMVSVETTEWEHDPWLP